MATEKLTTRLKNKTWNNLQIKNHKNSYELKTEQTKDMIQKSRTNVLKILNTLCGENCESSLAQVSKTKKFS